MSTSHHHELPLSMGATARAAAPDGASMAYEVSRRGDGPTVVLLHSLGADRRMWDGVRAELGDRYRLIMPDLRGHGESGGGPQSSVSEWPHDLAAILDAVVGTERVILAGVSLGGIHAMAFAVAYPRRVAGLVIADSFAELPTDVARAKIEALHTQSRENTMSAVAERYLADTFQEPYPPDADAVRGSIAAMDPESYRQAVTTCFGIQLSDHLAAITAPTLVLWGDRDAKTPRDLSERIVEGIAGARFGVVPDAGHLSNVDNPAGFARELRTFVDTCAQQARAASTRTGKEKD